MKRIALLAALLAAIPFTPAVTAAPAAMQAALSPERQVDALLAHWNRPGMPGAVVEVIRDGKAVLKKAYGMADIERNVPMTPGAAFVIGSNSKQFTAFAIQLLAEDGKLSLDDDIRKYVPEVPDYGKTITLRHLLHHTSGLRDYFALMFMAGLRGDDIIDENMALALIGRQRALNVDPGQEWVYSNTNYFLLALVVRRVSGEPLPEFARKRIFEPLGMRHTLFAQDYGTLVPGRALSYVPSEDGGYRYVAVGESTVGAGAVLSTADDLALWDRNFYDGRVGGMDVVRRMQETGAFNDGKPNDYASGLIVHTYRGQRMVEHGGNIGGYGTQLWRFPDQHLSVIVFANASDLDIWRTVAGISDIYLGRAASGDPAPAPAPIKHYKAVALDRAHLEALTGYYATSPQTGITFRNEDGQLTATSTGVFQIPVFASGARDLFAMATDAQFTFDAPGKDGVIAGGVLHRGGQDIPAPRTARPLPPDAALQPFEGDYYSDELHVLYSVARKSGDLVLTSPRGTTVLGFSPLGEYETGYGHLKYQCSGQGPCAGFTMNADRARNVQFRRVALAAPAAAR